MKKGETYSFFQEKRIFMKKGATLIFQENGIFMKMG